MMCLEESRNHNAASKPEPQMSPSSSKPSPAVKLALDRAKCQLNDQPPIQWARCLHCPRTWKCQGDTDLKDAVVLDVPYQGLTKFVPCDDCSKVSSEQRSTASEAQVQLQTSPSKDAAQMEDMQARNIQQFLANSILPLNGNITRGMDQSSMNLLNLLPLICHQIQQTRALPGLPPAASTNMDLFQNLLQQQQQLVQQQQQQQQQATNAHRYNVKENGAPQKKYEATPAVNHYDDNSSRTSSRLGRESYQQQQADKAPEVNNPIRKRESVIDSKNTIDLNRTRIALGQQQQSAKPTPNLQLDDHRLISILKTMPHLMLNPDSNTPQRQATALLQTSNRRDIKVASELSKRLEEERAPKEHHKQQQQQQQQFSSPAMQSLAEIGRSPGAIWKGEHDGRELTGLDETPFHCITCSKSFKSRSLLKIHQRVHVTSDGQNKCNMCDYVTADYHQLISHMHHKHSEQLRVNSSASNTSSTSAYNQTTEVSPVKCKPAVCPVCGRKSPSLGYLKIHMRSHKTTLDHVCHVCGRGFKEHWYLTTHLRTHDKGLVNSPQFNGASEAGSGIHTDEMRRVQHNEVQQQLRLMIERNRQNSEAYRVALQQAGNPLLSMKNNASMFMQNFELTARGEIIGGDHPLVDNDESANTSPSPPPFKTPSTEEDEGNEQYRFRVSKRKAFHPVKCSQDEVVPSKRVASPDLLVMAGEGWNHTTFGRRKSKPQKLDVGTDENLGSSDKEDVVSEEDSSVAGISKLLEPVEKESTSSNQPLDLRVLKIDENSKDSFSSSGNDEKQNGSVSR